MASYLETRLRKQRHNKAIVNRNTARRQLLLKQQPDVGAIESEDENLPEGVVPVYWRDDQSDGYDPRIRWTRGPRGRYYYDSSEGVRTFDDETIPEGFISEREFNNIVDQFSNLTGRDRAEVGRELQNSETSLAITWMEAVNGTYENVHPSNVEGTSMELLDGIVNRSVSLGGTASEGPGRYEAAGRTLSNAAKTMRRDQVAVLAEDGVYTTGHVREETRQRERELASMQEAVQEPESVDADWDFAARREEIQREADRVEQYEEALRQSREPAPRRRTLPYEKEGVSEEVFNSWSSWGQASLADSALVANNVELFQSFPDVWLSDAGNAEVPSRYKDAEVTVTPKSIGTVLKKNTKYPFDLVKRANDIVNAHNRTILEDSIAREGGVVEDLPNSFTALSRKDTSIKEAARADGVPEEVVSRLKERAVLHTFEEWMTRKDTLYKVYRRKARNQQKKNKQKYGSHTPQRVEMFDESGTGVVGTPTTDWSEEYGSFVKDAAEAFSEFQKVVIPSSARVWPPEEIGLSPKDDSKFINALQGGRTGKVRELIQEWFDYNVERLRLTDPVKASNEVKWDFAARQVESATSSIINNEDVPTRIISIDDNGAIGAVLNYSESDYGNWSVSSAGTSPKGFSSWPVDEITTALDNAIVEAGQDIPLMEQIRNPVIMGLRTTLGGWQEHGRPLESTTTRGVVDRYHAALVFFEFAARFLRAGPEKGKSVYTSGISGYVTDHYKRFGFAGGNNANRLNMLWTLTTQGGTSLPREKNEEGEDDVIQKSFGTGLNKVAYTEKHDTIKTDNRLDVLQEMLDNLMNKADERYGFTDKKLAQANEQELEDLQDYLEMDDEEFEEYLEGFMYMFAGTGSS
jgi:hypothetical protein